MKDILLITVDDIKDNAPISSSIDPQHLEPFLPLAQTFHLKPVLGEPLYNELINAVSGDTISDNNYTLLVNYVEPFLSWMAFYEGFPFIWSKTSAKGVTKSFSDNSQSLSKREFEMMKQEIYDKAITFKNHLVRYLEDNVDKFPSFRTEGSKKKGNSTGIYLGSTRFYDPRTDEWCCE